MPLDELHKKKRVKNFTVLAIILAFAILIWLVAMTRMANASGMPDRYQDQREKHQQEIEQTWEKYDQQGARHERARARTNRKMDKEREAHQDEIEQTWEKYDQQGVRHERARARTGKKTDKEREAHQKVIDAAAYDWWYGENASPQAKEVMEYRKSTGNE